MREKEKRGISIQVDRLTKSIEDAVSGERFETLVLRLFPEAINTIKKSHWQFDWKTQLLVEGREIYKLVRVVEPKAMQGLVCFENKADHIYIHLIESAKINKGKTKQYVGVAGNLFAFACKRSLELGYLGYVAFDSKTALIDHYIRSIGARHSHGQRLFLDEKVAKRLIIRYFSNQYFE